jgi:hypothetical protein
MARIGPSDWRFSRPLKHSPIKLTLEIAANQGARSTRPARPQPQSPDDVLAQPRISARVSMLRVLGAVAGMGSVTIVGHKRMPPYQPRKFYDIHARPDDHAAIHNGDGLRPVSLPQEAMWPNQTQVLILRFARSRVCLWTSS